jgi:hypothetical protein
MNKNKINVGRVKSRMVDKPWWMHCPLCPIHTGFNFHPSQERAWDAAERHLFREHPMVTNEADWALELVRRGKNA